MSGIGNLMKNNIVIAIIGPTASGKTETAIELSKLIPSEVISADSRQIYKYMDIGTAKPTKEELAAAKHHFIDIVNPDDYYSAGVFGNEAENAALEIIGRSKIPVVAGGSGLYIKALCEGLFEEESEHKGSLGIRQELESELKSNGIDILFDRLKNVDPVSAEKYIDKNPRRVLRALEYYLLSGKPISEAHISTGQKPFVTYYYGIKTDREALYDRINKRAEIMWASGLIEETKSLMNMGYSPSLNSMNTVGYKECIAYIEGKMPEPEALDKMKQATRNYAKRQMTWFRKIDKINWLEGSPKQIAQQIFRDLKTIIK